ncbi:ankyrin repeat-containing domain protein [Thelonectria olida]|uniref:Ankyrin repeat-containing domain protein n=1 Tax=Thelonectria olida TaxID=1576542 RepID=A0A9P8VTZ2_9HYPO|nr:ankyrin repeat-containing domain protein [Thelonectria olida]
MSGRLGTSNERVIPMLGYDHRQVCKHPSLTSRGMRMIISELRDVADREGRETMNSLPLVPAARPSNRLAINASAQSVQNDGLLREAASGNLAAVKRFIDNGADIDTHNHKLQTPLHLACQHGHVATGLLLCDKGANVSKVDEQGAQPLHAAASRGDHSLVLRILENGGDPNAGDRNGLTPLHRAADLGDEATVQHLLGNGADSWIRSNSNELPIRVARKASQWGVVRMLQQQKESVQEVRIADTCHLDQPQELTYPKGIDRISSCSRSRWVTH